MNVYTFFCLDPDGKAVPALHVVAKGFASAVSIALGNGVTDFVNVSKGPEVIVE